MPRLAVIGHPVAHSRSPAMQGAALEGLGLTPEWSYGAIDVTPEQFPELVGGLFARGYVGANVTVPHKLAALALADTCSEAAREIGAANTLLFSERAIHAENTDAIGLIEALPSSPDGARALVLGAGGSARACVWALRRAGAEVTVWNRTRARAEALAVEFGVELAETGPAGVEAGAFDLLVNATTVGLAQESGVQAAKDPRSALKSLPLNADAVREEHVVVDLVYGPSPTPLAALASERGARVIDGMEILVRQGAASLRIWTGLEAPIETMRRAAYGE